MKSLFLALLIVASVVVHSAENRPLFCTPTSFSKYEIPSPLSASDDKNLQRAHYYRLGNVTLVGMAIGYSKTPTMEKLANTFSPGVDKDKYCSWYFATKNKSAMAAFNSTPIKDPFKISPSASAQVFMDAVSDSFFTADDSFFRCAETHHYLAMGCSQQRHRGPTVFGMFLAFTGCSADQANTIVNNIWGLNGLNPQVRLNAIKAAYDYGVKHPSERAQMADLLTRKI